MPDLNIIVALACEAKPLVDRYRLAKQHCTAFPHFCGRVDDQREFNVNLVVSGIGTENMAAACGWLGALTVDSTCAWLNIGIAGHADLLIGEIALVVSSSRLNSDRNYYPPLVAKWHGKGVPLLSCNEPCSDYPDGHAVDMEASAFFAIATRFTTTELVQSLKVISDNGKSGLPALDASRFSALIAAQTDRIDGFARNLVKLVPPINERSDLLDNIQHLHVTVSQLQQFGDLLNKLANLGVDDARLAEKLNAAKSMRQLLTELRSLQLQTAPDLAVVQPLD